VKPKSRKVTQTDKRIDFTIYVQDGEVHCDWKMQKFPTDDLLVAQRLVDSEFAKAIKQGPTDD
jgi:hypothetical protein